MTIFTPRFIVVLILLFLVGKYLLPALFLRKKPTPKEPAPLELFGGMKVITTNPKLETFLAARNRFIEAYVKEKGWTKPLTIQQILEVRAQDGWKNPSINVHENRTPTKEI